MSNYLRKLGVSAAVLAVLAAGSAAAVGSTVDHDAKANGLKVTAQRANGL